MSLLFSHSRSARVAALIALASASACGTEPTVSSTTSLLSENEIMSAVEVQFSATIFQDIVQRLVAASGDCEAPTPCTEGSQELCYLDHVTFAASTGIEHWTLLEELTLPGGHVVNPVAPVVTVPVAAHYKTETCAKDPDCPANQFFDVESGTAYIKITIEKVSGQDALCGELVGLGCKTACPPDQPIKVCRPLDIKQLDDLGTGTPTVVGVAFSEDPPARVALRFDFSYVETGPNGEPTSMSSYFADKTQDFLSGDFFKPAPNAGVSLSLGQKLLRKAIKDEIVQGLTKPAQCATCTNNCPDACSIQHSPSSVSTSWHPNGSTAKIVAETYLVYQNDVCDVGFDVTVDVTLSFAPQLGELVSDIELSYSASYWDLLACAPGAGGVGGLITAAVGKAVAEDFAGEQSFAMGADCVENSSTSYTCRKRVALPAIDITYPGGTYQGLGFPLSQMAANAGGLHLFGDPQFPAPFVPAYTVSVEDPTLGVHGDCNDGYAGAMGRICRGGSAKVCSVQFDPQTTAGWMIDPGWGPDGNGCTPVIPDFTPADPKDPFSPETQPPPNDLELMVHTTAGVRSYRMNAPPPLTEEQLNDLYWAGINKKLECSLDLAPDMAIDYDPLWDIDPPDHLDPLRNRFASVIGPERLVTYGIAAITNLELDLRDDGLWLYGSMTFGGDLQDRRALQTTAWRHQLMNAEQVRGHDLSTLTEMVLEEGADITIPVSAEIATWTWDATVALQLGYAYDAALLEAHRSR